MRAMLHRVFCFVLLAIACTGCGPSAEEGQLTGADPRCIERHGRLLFLNDVDLAYRFAGERQLPCMLFFTAEWCTYCHRMADAAFGDQHVAELAPNFVCVIVDADRYRGLCSQLRISGYPTVVFVGPGGHHLHRLVGQQSPADLAAGMRAALGRYAWVGTQQLR